MAFELKSIESTVFVIFLSVIAYLIFKPDLNTAEFCTTPKHQRGHTLTLRDGRTLSYITHGPKSGFPILHFHPMPTSRLFSHPDIEDVTTEAGVWLIIPDRPGVGLSSPHPGRTLLDWAEDMGELMAHLGIDTLAVSGHSAGVAYAFAVAHKFPNRVTRVASVGGAVFPSSFGESQKDSDWENLFEGMRSSNKMLAYLGAEQPSILSVLFKISTNSIVDANQTIRDISGIPAESSITKNPKWRAHLYDSILESFRQGTSALYDELVLIPKSWGFHIREINIPTSVWLGSEDTFTTRTMSKYISKTVVKGELNIVEGVGHWSLWSENLQKILEELTERVY